MNCGSCAKNAFRAMAASSNISRTEEESPCSVEQGSDSIPKLVAAYVLGLYLWALATSGLYYFSVFYNLAQHKALYYIYYCTVYT
jgi:hypothetical protein